MFCWHDYVDSKVEDRVEREIPYFKDGVRRGDTQGHNMRYYYQKCTKCGKEKIKEQHFLGYCPPEIKY